MSLPTRLSFIITLMALWALGDRARADAPATAPTTAPCIRRSMENFLSEANFEYTDPNAPPKPRELPKDPNCPVGRSVEDPGTSIIAFPDYQLLSQNERAGMRYHVLADGRILMGKDKDDKPLYGIVDVAKRELTVGGRVYVMNPQLAAGRPATLPAQDPPLTAAEFRAVFRDSTFTAGPTNGFDTPRISFEDLKMEIRNGRQTTRYFIKLQAPDTIIVHLESDPKGPGEPMTYNDADQSITFHGVTYRKHPWDD